MLPYRRLAGASWLMGVVGQRHAACTNNWYSRRMGRNTSFSLDEHFNAFIEDEVASGRYRSASDVVRAALRLLEERETRLNALRDALVAGENSGASTPFEFDTFVSRKRARGPHGR
jgi:antitoxin ParD1/3/4